MQINLKDLNWLVKQKIAGRCVSCILKECGKAISSESKNLKLKDFEGLALLYSRTYDCIPTFLNYNGFPNAICTSVNNQLVHGLVEDYELQPGDVISIDVGMTFDGTIADAARTWIYGAPKTKGIAHLVRSGRLVLEEAQKAVIVGNRIGSIGNCIYKKSRDLGYNVITEYGGHGLDYNQLHALPFIANKDSKDNGIHMANGLSIAIEPMLVQGSVKTKIGDNKWTVYTQTIGCHFENSVTIFDDKVHIITEDLC